MNSSGKKCINAVYGHFTSHELKAQATFENSKLFHISNSYPRSDLNTITLALNEIKPCFKSLIQKLNGLGKSSYFDNLILLFFIYYLIEYSSNQFISENDRARFTNDLYITCYWSE